QRAHDPDEATRFGSRIERNPDKRVAPTRFRSPAERRPDDRVESTRSRVPPSKDSITEPKKPGSPRSVDSRRSLARQLESPEFSEQTRASSGTVKTNSFGRQVGMEPPQGAGAASPRGAASRETTHGRA